jgi:hypothetical protein
MASVFVANSIMILTWSTAKSLPYQLFRLGLGLELESSSLYPIVLDIFLFTGEARVQESQDFFKKELDFLTGE